MPGNRPPLDWLVYRGSSGRQVGKCPAMWDEIEKCGYYHSPPHSSDSRHSSGNLHDSSGWLRGDARIVRLRLEHTHGSHYTRSFHVESYHRVVLAIIAGLSTGACHSHQVCQVWNGKTSGRYGSFWNGGLPVADCIDYHSASPGGLPKGRHAEHPDAGGLRLGLAWPKSCLAWHPAVGMALNFAIAIGIPRLSARCFRCSSSIATASLRPGGMIFLGVFLSWSNRGVPIAGKMKDTHLELPTIAARVRCPENELQGRIDHCCPGRNWLALINFGLALATL